MALSSTEQEALCIIASGWIRVKEIRPGYWIPERLAAGTALRWRRPDLCRNGLPHDYDELLNLASECGLGLEYPSEDDDQLARLTGKAVRS